MALVAALVCWYGTRLSMVQDYHRAMVRIYGEMSEFRFTVLAEKFGISREEVERLEQAFDVSLSYDLRKSLYRDVDWSITGPNFDQDAWEQMWRRDQGVTRSKAFSLFGYRARR